MTEQMKAAIVKQVGPPENLIYDNFPKPKEKDDEILVKVQNTVVNHIDTYLRSGKFPIKLTTPFILGRDVCGVVESVGKNVKKFKVGDQVWAYSLGNDGHQGAYAEYVAIPEKILYKLPEGVDPKEAIGVFHSSLTACHGLIRFAKLMKGETIFINGGAGNVGSVLIQFARSMGATIIATAGSKEKVEWCLSLGAHKAINYKNEDVSKVVKEFAPEGVNVYWDTTREPNFETAIPLLAKKGRMIIMSGAEAHPTFPVGDFYRKDCSLFGYTVFTATTEELQVYADIINRCLLEGQLQAKIDRVLPLSEAAKAHKLIEIDKTIWGKIILTPK